MSVVHTYRACFDSIRLVPFWLKKITKNINVFHSCRDMVGTSDQVHLTPPASTAESHIVGSPRSVATDAAKQNELAHRYVAAAPELNNSDWEDEFAQNVKN